MNAVCQLCALPVALQPQPSGKITERYAVHCTNPAQIVPIAIMDRINNRS